MDRHQGLRVPLLFRPGRVPCERHFLHGQVCMHVCLCCRGCCAYADMRFACAIYILYFVCPVLCTYDLVYVYAICERINPGTGTASADTATSAPPARASRAPGAAPTTGTASTRTPAAASEASWALTATSTAAAGGMGNAILGANASAMSAIDTTVQHVCGLVIKQRARKGALGQDSPVAVRSANSVFAWMGAAGQCHIARVCKSVGCKYLRTELWLICLFWDWDAFVGWMRHFQYNDNYKNKHAPACRCWAGYMGPDCSVKSPIPRANQKSPLGIFLTGAFYMITSALLTKYFVDKM